MDTVEIYCGECKSKLDNELEICKCGSKKKIIHLILEDEIGLLDQTRIKSKGDKKKIEDYIDGYESSSEGKIIYKQRIINKSKDVYFEKITDMDGKILHSCDEKLSEHTGHGSAKFSKINSIIFREAQLSDIPQIQIVRHSVKENVLSDPSLVTDKNCEEFLTERGKGWVCEIDGNVVGFSIADLKENNIWALFVHPDHFAKGIGKRLHKEMLYWYFDQTKETVWLGTAPNTRAEKFYRLNGWKEVGIHGKGEIKFEMSYEDWNLSCHKDTKALSNTKSL